MPIIGGRELLFVRYIFAGILVSETIKHWMVRWIRSRLSMEIHEGWILSWRWRQSGVVIVTSPISRLILVRLIWWYRTVVIVSIIVVIRVISSLEGFILSEVARTLITWPEISSGKGSWGWHHSPSNIVPCSPIPRVNGRVLVSCCNLGWT